MLQFPFSLVPSDWEELQEEFTTTLSSLTTLSTTLLTMALKHTLPL